MKGRSISIHNALQEFAEAVTAKSSLPVRCAPEDQLRGPFENFLAHVAGAWNENIVCAGEAPLPNRLGRPDYAVHRSGLLAGFVELKAPGTGANVVHFRGHDRAQFKRFSTIPNILYTDGNEWALYRSGERARQIVRFSADVASDGRNAVTTEDARALEPLLRDFLAWEPILPLDRRRQIDLKGFASMLAPLCRILPLTTRSCARTPAFTTPLSKLSVPKCDLSMNCSSPAWADRLASPHRMS